VENLTKNQLSLILEKQKVFFATHESKNIDFRVSQLRKLKTTIKKYAPQVETVVNIG
jgi:aldehyde dehydrogenase (NAD+)